MTNFISFETLSDIGDLILEDTHIFQPTNLDLWVEHVIRSYPKGVSQDELHERIMEKERLSKKRVGAAALGAAAPADDAAGAGPVGLWGLGWGPWGTLN